MSSERLNYTAFESFFRNDIRLKEIKELIWMPKKLEDIDNHEQLVYRITNNPIFDCDSDLRTNALDLYEEMRSEVARNVADIQNNDHLQRYLEHLSKQIIVLDEWFTFWFRVVEVQVNLATSDRQLRDRTVVRLLNDILYLSNKLTQSVEYLNKLTADYFPEKILTGTAPTIKDSELKPRQFIITTDKIAALHELLNSGGQIWEPLDIISFIECFDLNNVNDFKPVFKCEPAFIRILSRIDPAYGGVKVNDAIALQCFGIRHYRQSKNKKRKTADRILFNYNKKLKEILPFNDDGVD